MAWRTFEFAHGKNPDADYFRTQLELAFEAREAWRNFLLDETDSPSKFPQHVIFFRPGIETNATELPTNWNRFQLRQITLDIVGSPRGLMTYTKLGPFTFFGMIQHQKRDWKGTRINASGGRFPPKKVEIPATVLPLFEEKAALSRNAFNNVSERQSELIGKTMKSRLENPDGDAHIEAMLADYEMFGLDILRDD